MHTALSRNQIHPYLVLYLHSPRPQQRSCTQRRYTGRIVCEHRRLNHDTHCDIVALVIGTSTEADLLINYEIYCCVTGVQS
jgi:hypothetical protein